MANKFGEFIKKLRHERRLTLRGVEKKVKISGSYICQLEKGDRSPTLASMEKIAEAYGVPVSFLVDSSVETEIPPPNAEFMVRGYERLTEEHKRFLESVLRYLTDKE